MSARATSAGSKPPLYKVVMLGDSGVGKTSLVARLTNPDRPMNHDISATMGIEFDTQMLDTEHGRVKAQIWDMNGTKRLARVLLPTYFRKAKGVILVYDITNAKSFENLSEWWMAQLNDHATSDDLAKLLVGNKSDLESFREVPREKAERFCADFDMDLLETSAKTGENVLRAFEALIGIVHGTALAGTSRRNPLGRAAGSQGTSQGGGFRLEESGGAPPNGAPAGGAGGCGC
mmetsp:Transcript_44645/g.87548  ORF Transcript_44645/g.87548 Transcript_44645/m.87548 type:complete len:233 (+) Transcript_44645:397-1095(+)